MTENMEVPMRLPNTPAETSPEQDVELTIRQAYQADNDLVFSCPLNWTIKQVKEHVRNCLDSHPAVTSQRLIFSGASLRDEQILSNVLRESSRSFVTGEGEQVFFHLMITQPYQAAPESEVRRRNVAGAANPTAPSAELHPAYAQNAAAWSQYWEAYQRLSPEAQTEENQRLMAHYYSYASTTPMWAPLQQQAPAPVHPQNALAAWRARVNGQQAPAAAAAPAAAPAGGNGGRVDFLEVTYRVFKLILLFSAILLYSSFERFALVLCAALFIYFIQLRRNHARNRAQVAAAAPAQPQEQPVNNNNNGENEGGEGNTAPPAEGEAAAEPAPAAPVEPPQSSMQVFLATCYSFVTSFFASLVPDHPMPMDLN